MKGDEITSLIAHCKTAPNAHALVVVSNRMGAVHIASQLAHYGIQLSLDSQSGDYVADVDNFHGGEGRISVRVAWTNVMDGKA